jgi:hypothetical protein
LIEKSFSPKLTDYFRLISFVFFLQNVIVSWKPPPEHTRNGELIFYRVEYRSKLDTVTKNMLVPAKRNGKQMKSSDAEIQPVKNLKAKGSSIHAKIK